MHKKAYFGIVLIGLINVIVLIGCIPYKYGSHDENESTAINIMHGTIIKDKVLQEQEDVAMNGTARGIFDIVNIPNSATGIIADKIKDWIQNEKDKYDDDYEFSITSNSRHLNNDLLYFYKDVSSRGAFDPEGLQFKGFTLARMCGKDTAMKAEFEIDTTNLWEIYSDGIFRLKLKNFAINFAKPKIPKHGNHKIDIAFEIEFKSTYISKDGQFHNDASIGKFYFTMNDIELRNSDSYKKYLGKNAVGTCIIVPRSYGYSKLRDQGIWNQGAFSIHVKAKEASKPQKINKFIQDNSIKLLSDINGDN